MIAKTLRLLKLRYHPGKSSHENNWYTNYTYHYLQELEPKKSYKISKICSIMDTHSLYKLIL